MRNSKYLIGAVLGVIGALAFSGVASAAILGQTETSVVAPSKQDSKKFGGASQSNVIATQLNDPANTQPPKTTVFTFDSNVKFTNGNLPVCPASALNGTVEQAAATCASSVVGSGSVQATTATGVLSGPVVLISGGPTILYVKPRVGTLNLPALVGVFAGRTLTFDNLPRTPGTILSNFTTKLGVSSTGALLKTGGKSYYFSARCKPKGKSSKGKWVVSETTTFYDGVQKSSTSVQTCKVKPSKK